ncbi:MAG TPA: thiol peroxidase [Rectinemataceae bacterium]|nr:thiol peroxidase [Rectinemataceae bacterium]
MATVTLRGNQIHTAGSLPAVGGAAPDFKLTTGDLSDVSLADFAGKVKIMSVSPSLDTSVCALSAKKFEQEVKKLGGAVVLHVSRDLPFAQSRFCKAEGVESVIPLSELRDRSFGKSYGVELTDGPMAGLLCRAVVVVDASNRVVHAELVPEITQEPDYGKAMEAARKALAPR